jgi:cysteinyl-tRNA synthetase
MCKSQICSLVNRYFFLQGHYRSQINFTWDALDASKTALHRLRHQILELQKRAKKDDLKEDVAPYHEKFRTALSEDLNVPKALAVVWEVLSTDLSPESKLNLIYNFDTVLGLSLESSPLVKIVIPEDIKKRITERDKARANKDFAKSDELRAQIEAAGYEVLDTKDGTKVEIKKKKLKRSNKNKNKIKNRKKLEVKKRKI